MERMLFLHLKYPVHLSSFKLQAMSHPLHTAIPAVLSMPGHMDMTSFSIPITLLHLHITSTNAILTT